jgi:hypothetical protein
LPGLKELGITASALSVIAPNYLDSSEAGLLLVRRRAAGRF